MVAGEEAELQHQVPSSHHTVHLTHIHKTTCTQVAVLVELAGADFEHYRQYSHHIVYITAQHIVHITLFTSQHYQSHHIVYFAK